MYGRQGHKVITFQNLDGPSEMDNNDKMGYFEPKQRFLNKNQHTISRQMNLEWFGHFEQLGHLEK